MILIDANLLLYAYDTESPHHEPSRVWLDRTLGGHESVGMALVVLLAFLRIATSSILLSGPLRPDEAMAIVTQWLERPMVELLQPTEKHWSLLANLVRTGQARGPVLMDAHLAALAIEYGATLYSTDRDFARFPKLRFRNPIAD